MYNPQNTNPMPLQFESSHGIGDMVRLNFGGNKIECSIHAVKFTHEGKTLYDVLVQVEGGATVLGGVDSAFVESV